MAKKKDNKLDSQFDLDSGLDDFFTDFPDPTVKDDRKPAIKILSGIKQGVVDTATDPKFIAKSLREVFPPGYGQAADEADRIVQTTKSLYDDALKEIKPAIRQTKQTIARLVPENTKYLPKWAGR